MAEVERRTAASIPARRAAKALARTTRTAVRDDARGRVRGLERPPTRTAGSPGRRKQPLPDLDPECSADVAARLVLVSLASSMWDMEATILAGADGQAVHDLRITSRRARTLLGQVRSALSRSSTKKLRDGLRWLGESSGPLRDLDILAKAVKDARPELPVADQDAVDRLLAQLDAERERARRQLVEELRSPRHARLVEAFARFTAPPRRGPGEATVSRARSRPSDASAGAMPIKVIAAESIARVWRRVLRRGRRIDASSPAEDLHRVRIDGKKLRYLLEMFRSVYPDVELGPVIASLKELQDCLGALNDAAVQERILRRLASDLDRDGSSGGSAESAATLLTIGRLIERGSAQSAGARRRFEDRLEDLESKEHRKRIKALSV